MEKQFTFYGVSSKHRYSHGGSLRRVRKGRGVRPLACKLPLHVVLKINPSRLKHRSLRAHRSFKLIHYIVQRYAQMFYVKVEQITIQHDHLHLLIRTSRRSSFHYFFRVVAGQIAQEFLKRGLSFENHEVQRKTRVTDTPQVTKKAGDRSRDREDLASNKSSQKNETAEFWKFRPFSRVVKGYKAYKTVRDYIQLNELEATGRIQYSKLRLRGLSSADWCVLWS